MDSNQTQPVEAPVTQPAAASEFFPSLSKPATITSDSAPTAAPEWFIMEGLKGEGERPAYFSSKYKTLVDQAKAYTELEKKLGSAKSAPDKYDISKYEAILKPEDMTTQKLLNVARERHVSQEGMEGILDVFSEYLSAQEMDVSKEIEKLGPNGRERINVVAQWIQNTFSEKAIESLNKLPKNADFINFMDEVRQLQHANRTSVPSAEGTPSKFVPLTVGEVEAEMKANFQRYNEDPRYRAEIKAKFAQAVGE